MTYSSSRRERLTPERWAEIAPLIDSVLDAPVDQRHARVASICGDDIALAAELMRFVNDDDASAFFAHAERERQSLFRDRLFDTTVDLSRVLQRALDGIYVIDRELGGGGMSRVFSADEVALGRKVVIKVLPAELAEGVNTERLGHEIRLAASLQQANIVPVISAGSAGGFPYYTMPLVEGRSLRDRLSLSGALPLNEAVSIMRDVARALAYAHDRGVVHCDIKPGNILLSDRTAVVTDFGIARAVGVARDDNGDAPSTTMATPAYAAPEQILHAHDIDHRADIYSFGCVAWEILAGRSRGSLTQPGSKIPPAIARLITKCLEPNPDQRPQTATEILGMLEDALAEPARKTVLSRTNAAAVTIAALAIATAAFSYYKSVKVNAQPLSFAAIPFMNTARDTSLDYRSDGMGDEILNGISKVGGVQIVGRTTAFRYRNANRDLLEIERALGARLLLTGTLRENEGKLIVSAQLNDSISRAEIWAESFTHDAASFGSVTNEIVQRVAGVLRERFGSRIVVPRGGVMTSGTSNAAALDWYLIGQSQVRRRGSGIKQGIASFQRAIDLDTGYARAHAALAMALTLDPFFNGTPAKNVTARIISEATRALELDSSLADAHAALGSAHAYEGRWESSDGEMRHALALDPYNAMIRQTFGRQLIIQGRTDEALSELQRARSVEPTSPLISAWLAYAFFLAGRMDSAIVESERTIALDPVGLPTTNLISLVSLGLNRRNVARELVKVPVDRGMTNAAYIYATLGDLQTANRINLEMERRNPQPWFIHVSKASVLLAEGDSAAALTALERSARDSGTLWVFFIPLADPAFDQIRDSRRFAALLRSANLSTITRRRPIELKTP
ncbi:MAG TPA: protein kinase [Gemmatimonadaceae bacterium]